MINFIKNKKEILKGLLIVGFLFLPLFFIFYPLLFQRKIFSSSFIFNGMYPIFYHYSNILKCCNYIPIWFSSYLGGFPVLLTQGFGFLHPFSIIFFKFFDYILAYNWLVVISGFLTSFFTYLLARELKLSKPASLVAGIIFLFNGLVIQWLPILAFAYFLPIYPLAFLLILKIDRNKNKSPISYGYISLLILIITIGWVSAFTEVIFYLVLAVIAFSLFVDFENFKKCWGGEKLSPLKELKTTKQFFIALVISSIFASIWTLPVYQLSKMSPRSGGLSLEEAYRGSSNWGDYFATFNFNASLGGNASSVFYIGIFSIFLVIFSVFCLKQNRFVRFYWILFLLVFIIMAPHSPILWFIHKFPPFSFFRGGFKYFFLGHLSLAILAGFGLDAMKKLKGNVVWGKLLFYLSVSFIAVIAGLLSFRFIFYQIFDFFNDTYFLNNKWHDKIWVFLDKSYRHSSFFDFYSIVSLIFFVASFSLLYAYKNDKISFRIFAIVVLFFITANLSFFWKDYYNRYPLISDHYLRETTQLTTFLQKRKKEGEVFRITRFYPGMEHYYKKIDYIDQYEFSRGTIAPNLNIVYNLDSINAFEEGLTTRRQARILEKIYSESISVGNLKDEYKNMSLEEKLRYFNSAFNVNLLSMMNVKYALSASKLNGEWKKVFESDEINQGIPIYIYENSKVLPRIYFANQVRFIKTDEDNSFKELIINKDFSKLTVIECEYNCNNGNKMETKDTLDIIEERNGYLKLRTKTESGKYLVLSETHLPFWMAIINDNSAKIYPANYIYQAIFVPPGESEIEFKYPGLFEQYLNSFKLFFNQLI